MKAKLLNPLQTLMNSMCGHSIDLLAQNSNSPSYSVIKEWFGDTVLMYSLTVASGNNTYLKTSKTVFDTHIIGVCEVRTHCNDISQCLGDMITLLTA